MTEHPSRVTVLGQSVRVSVRPGTSSRPLVVCNGIGASFELLQPFVDELDPSITVVRFDVPGVGGSPAPAVPYNFAGLAWFLGRMLDRLNYRDFDVLGISWGGGLAQQVAFQFPRRCRHAILVSTGTGSLMVPAHPRVLAKMITPRRYVDAEYAATVAADLYGGRLREQPELVRGLMHDSSRVGSRKGYLFQLIAGMAWSSLPALPLIRQPVLVLAGSDDPIVPVANARLMTQLLPHATLHIFDDGHLGLVTQADMLGPMVSEFVRDDLP